MLALLILFSGEIWCQHPRVFANQAQIIEQGIDRLFVILDSASQGLHLPFDTVKTIQYDPSGRPLSEIGFTSDVYIIHNSIIYSYQNDTVVLIKTDSVINPAPIDEGPPLRKKEIMVYKNGLIRKEVKDLSSYYKSTRIYSYNQDDCLSHIEIYSNNTLSSIRTYEYDEKQRIVSTVKTKVAANNSGGTEIEHEYIGRINYIYLVENGELRIPPTNKPNNHKLKIEEEIILNSKGQIIQMIEYDRNGSIWYVTNFQYYDNGLLRSEEAYKNGTEFSYRFLTLYEMHE